MPRLTNKYAGIKKRTNGNYLARAYHDGSEYSRQFRTVGEANAWREATQADLKRAPVYVTLSKGLWRASIETPSGCANFAADELSDAVQWYQRTRAQLDAGIWVDPITAAMTLGEYIERWRKNKIGISEKTWADYESLIRNHISLLSPIPLRQISTNTVSTWIADLLRNGVGTSAIRYSHRVLRSILQTAVRDDLLIRNPAAGVKLPPRPPKRMRALSPEEIHLLASACGNHYENLILFAAHSGLRIGELCALRVSDVDWHTSEVTVSKSWTTGRSGKRMEGPTKTRQTRVVPVPRELLGRLSDVAGQRLPDDYLFVGVAGGPVHDGSLRRYVFNPARERVGLPSVRIHDLRHTCASLLIRLGAPITNVSQILGHSTPTETLNTYGHLYEGDSAKWIDALAGFVAQGSTASVDQN